MEKKVWKNLCKEHYHNEVSCPFVKEEEEEKKKNIEFNYQIKKCDFCKGEIKNMEPIECPFCKGLFCLQHKIESDHKCKIWVCSLIFPFFNPPGSFSQYLFKSLIHF